MTFRPSPKQSLLLWRMLTGETSEEREPALSKTKPRVSLKESQPLIAHGFLFTEKRGRASHLLLTDHAWAWASSTADVTFSKSAEAATALQGLLRRLLPFLEKNDLALASLFMENGEADAQPPFEGRSAQTHATETSERSLVRQLIESTYLKLSGGQRKQRVPLADLRSHLPQVPRAVLDRELIALQRELKLVLYREDNSAALHADDHAAALIVGDSPRHLVIWEN